ncbi:MAG: rRNA adenine methyltransferase [Bacteroidota bacterium]
MQFDTNNPVIQLCIKGMEMEAQNPIEAKAFFSEAWDKATSDVEKFTAAHYLARQQPTIAQKLEWDETALLYALKIDDGSMLQSYPSLYLNIGKCYEDENDFDTAEKNYRLALSYTDHLPDNGYGQMIKAGIINGLKRVAH